MLLERGMTNEALPLRSDPEEGAEPPGRLAGAAKAAEKTGDMAKARQYYEKIVAIAEDAESTRRKCRRRAFLKKKS